MTPKERLELYEKALVDYESFLDPENWLLYREKHKILNVGFCGYFRHVHRIKVNYNDLFKEVFPELYSCRKTPFYYDYHYYSPSRCDFFQNLHWNVKNRIEALKKAIEITKEKWDL